MAIKTIYITVKLDISNDKVSEITDEDVEDVLDEKKYHFVNVNDFEMETEICGLNK